MKRDPYKQAKAPPPPRRPDLERVICGAIRDKVQVSFLYKPGDTRARSFAPLVSWVTAVGNACVNGVQTISESGRTEQSVQTFTIAKMRNLQTTGTSFAVPRDFDFYKHREGVICIVRPG